MPFPNQGSLQQSWTHVADGARLGSLKCLRPSFFKIHLLQEIFHSWKPPLCSKDGHGHRTQNPLCKPQTSFLYFESKLDTHSFLSISETRVSFIHYYNVFFKIVISMHMLVISMHMHTLTNAECSFKIVLEIQQLELVHSVES